MKAIPTLYDGHHFRSRLEARWAVFFNYLGIQYEYEPKGFDFGNGLRYLPDFLVHGVEIVGWDGQPDTFIEIKANIDVPQNIELIKVEALARQLQRPVIICFGPPWPDTIVVVALYSGSEGQCKTCSFRDDGKQIIVAPSIGVRVDLTKRLQDAYMVARSARFDLGIHLNW